MIFCRKSIEIKQYLVDKSMCLHTCETRSGHYIAMIEKRVANSWRSGEIANRIDVKHHGRQSVTSWRGRGLENIRSKGAAFRKRTGRRRDNDGIDSREITGVRDTFVESGNSYDDDPGSSFDRRPVVASRWEIDCRVSNTRRRDNMIKLFQT